MTLGKSRHLTSPHTQPMQAAHTVMGTVSQKGPKELANREHSSSGYLIVSFKRDFPPPENTGPRAWVLRSGSSIQFRDKPTDRYSVKEPCSLQHGLSLVMVSPIPESYTW